MTWDSLWSEAKRRDDWSHPDDELAAWVRVFADNGVARVLDLGCGVGRHLVLFARAGFEVHGLDRSTTAIALCRRRAQECALQFQIVRGDMTSLPYCQSAFDLVVAWNVIYHTTRHGIDLALREIKRVLAPRGYAYLTLNSTRNGDRGPVAGPFTSRVGFGGKVDGAHLHHYSDYDEVLTLLRGWDVLDMKEGEQTLAGAKLVGSWHWTVVMKSRGI